MMILHDSLPASQFQTTIRLRRAGCPAPRPIRLGDAQECRNNEGFPGCFPSHPGRLRAVPAGTGGKKSEGWNMHIELSRDDAEALRDLLRQRVVELDKEINRTDSLSFKEELRQLDRTIERVLGEVSVALANAPRG